MSFQWTEFLALARFLHTATTPEITREAALRSAVSRAYYAAYGHARNHAVAELFGAEGSADDHLALRLHFDRTGRTDVGKLLAELRHSRNRADYDEILPRLEMIANESIGKADRIIRRLVTPKT